MKSTKRILFLEYAREGRGYCPTLKYCTNDRQYFVNCLTHSTTYTKWEIETHYLHTGRATVAFFGKLSDAIKLVGESCAGPLP